MSVCIRPAVATDVPWILDELRAWDRVSGLARSLYPEEAYARAMIAVRIDDGPFWVAERAGGGVGFLAGYVCGHWLHPEVRVLTELLWWVSPSARGSRAAALLLRAFVAYGREHADMTICTIGARTGIGARALERHGFVAYEQNFLLEVA